MIGNAVQGTASPSPAATMKIQRMVAQSDDFVALLAAEAAQDIAFGQHAAAQHAIAVAAARTRKNMVQPETPELRKYSMQLGLRAA